MQYRFTKKQVQPPEPKIIYEDKYLLAINKPQGIVSEHESHLRFSVESMALNYCRSREKYPQKCFIGMPQRLDRPVSGVLLFAKKRSVLKMLVETFTKRELDKSYYAIVETRPEKDEAELVNWLVKDTLQRKAILHKTEVKDSVRAVLRYQFMNQNSFGTGKKAVDQMMNERAGVKGEMAYAYQIDMNALPHIDVFLDNGYTKEEMKMVHETKKIMGDDSIRVTATTVRIPTIGGHSESVNIEFENDFDLDEVRTLLSNSPGVVVVDDVKNLKYPMPIHAHDKDDTFVGRIRRDETQGNTLNCWIVSDNLRKGAATNAVQIAEYLMGKHLL